MISIEHPWHPREQGLLLMKQRSEEQLGLHMVKMAGTFDEHWKITDAIQFTLQKLDPAEKWKQLNVPHLNSNNILLHPANWQRRLWQI
jgi:hypothetical protein